MRIFIIISILICTLSVNAQSTDYTKKYPSKHGFTHHNIQENKIEMMKDAQFAIENIKKYKLNRDLGYGLVIIGVGTLYYASSHMDVPIRFSNGYNESLADRNKRKRLIVGAIGIAVTGIGTYIIVKNCKLLKKIEIRLQPNSGGLKFIF